MKYLFWYTVLYMTIWSIQVCLWRGRWSPEDMSSCWGANSSWEQGESTDFILQLCWKISLFFGQNPSAKSLQVVLLVYLQVHVFVTHLYITKHTISGKVRTKIFVVIFATGWYRKEVTTKVLWDACQNHACCEKCVKSCMMEHQLRSENHAMNHISWLEGRPRITHCAEHILANSLIS